jgi:hypothetical protein
MSPAILCLPQVPITNTTKLSPALTYDVAWWAVAACDQRAIIPGCAVDAAPAALDGTAQVGR